jgi:hypothetical protein
MQFLAVLFLLVLATAAIAQERTYQLPTATEVSAKF